MQSKKAIKKPSTSSRYKSRSFALQILYKMDVTTFPDDARLEKEVQEHCDYFLVPVKMRPFVLELVLGTRKNLKDIDINLKDVVSHWKIERIDLVDRNLLRMAYYEMITAKITHPAIVMNEAIEIAKEFASSDSASFINGVLDKVREKYLQEPVELVEEVYKEGE